MATVAIALGSNVDPVRNVPRASGMIEALPGVRVVARSAVYRTASAGPDRTPDGRPEFHNAVVLVECDMGPLALRSRLRAIEAALGRRRSADKFAPRPIDLDIVFHGSLVVHTDQVEIPDPGALRLPHISVPLADVAPDWRPPGESTTAADAAASHELVVVG